MNGDLSPPGSRGASGDRQGTGRAHEGCGEGISADPEHCPLSLGTVKSNLSWSLSKPLGAGESEVPGIFADDVTSGNVCVWRVCSLQRLLLFHETWGR